MNPSPAPTGFFRAGRRLYVVGIALIAITVLAAAITIRDLREQAIEDYQRDMTNIGVLLVEQMSRSLQAVDLVIRETRERALAGGADTSERFTALLGTENFHRFLRDELKSLPQANALILVNAAGKVVNFSRRWPIPDIDISDRDFFRQLRDHDQPDVLVTEPVKTPPLEHGPSISSAASTDQTANSSVLSKARSKLDTCKTFLPRSRSSGADR